MWFRVASVVVGIFHVVPCALCGARVSVGFVWPAWYSRCVIWHVVSCGQCSRLKFCRVVSWPACYTRCFMWFRVASVVLEMFHVVSCGQLEIRDV